MKNLSITYCLFLSLVLFSCSKQDKVVSPIIEQDETITSKDLTVMEDLLDDTENQATEEIAKNLTGNLNTTCPIVSFSAPLGTYPNTVTIDYGTDGCLGPNGKIRKGQIIVEMTDALLSPGSVRTINLIDFYVNETQIEGTKVISNNGLNGDNIPSFTKTIMDAKISFPDGTSISWEASHTVAQIEGFFSFNNLQDDVFALVGSSSGVNRYGKNFSAEITSPIIKRRNCKWIVKGVRELTLESNTRSINFGDGTCDRKALVTLANGNQVLILLPL